MPAPTHDLHTGLATAAAQVLNVSHNNLRTIPPELGWLPLKQLNIQGNPDPIPMSVLVRGFRWAQLPDGRLCRCTRIAQMSARWDCSNSPGRASQGTPPVGICCPMPMGQIMPHCPPPPLPPCTAAPAGQ